MSHVAAHHRPVLFLQRLNPTRLHIEGPPWATMRLGLRAVGVLLVLGAVVASTQAVALSDTSTCSAVEVGQRIDCFPRGTASQSACEARGCCWSPPPGVSNATQVPMGASRDAVPGTFARGAAQAMGTPYCFYPNG